MATEIVFNAAEFLANLDRVSDGAASRFFARTSEVLAPIKADAAAKWPQRSGKASKGFKLEEKVTATQLRASLANDVTSGDENWPVYRQLWSRYDEEARDRARAEHVNAAFSRGEGRKGRTPAQNRVTEERAERQMDRLMGVGKYKNWPNLRHWGEVPPVGFTRKLPWHWLVRRPGQAASGALVADLQADMLALARGA